MAPKKGSAAAKNAKKSASTVPDSDHIVFSNKPDDKKKKEQKDPKEPEAAPRPDPRKVIGGASWTGKLPVNLLSEHCQRQKWNKPEYQGRQAPAGGNGEKLHRSWVVLSKTDPKSREIIKLPPFQLPATHAQLADQPSALESRHFAAAYTLFRVCSMKNLAMALPPTYRDLWKGEFQRLKDEDVKEDRAWKYDADPFAADVKRQEIKAAIEKRRQDQALRPPAVESLSLVGPNSTHSSGRGWDRAPKVELGRAARLRIESIVRSRSIWNPNALRISKAEGDSITADLTKSGFQPSHIREALEFCGNREEVLEWLLIHVPEDSLPKWSFPPGYNTGVSLVSSDLSTDAKIKRLSEGGYPNELCIQALRDNDGNEGLAAEALQTKLVPPKVEALQDITMDVWSEEMTTLEAILDERFAAEGLDQCSIKTDPRSSISAVFHFRRPAFGYPTSSPPIITIGDSKLPSHVRLSIIKKAVAYAQGNLLGEQMIFSLLEWLDVSLPGIIADPGRLSDLEIASSSLKVQNALSVPDRRSTSGQNKKSGRRYVGDARSDKAVLEAWTTRQGLDEYKRMIAAREKLPAWQKKQSLVEVVKRGQVTLVTGETGSGKSTQAVQFILDDAIQKMKGSSANIICTQPRRVAALSLSERVKAERCVPEGDEVGYVIRGDSKVSARTKITFMTTGVLLRRLQGSGSLKSALADISHVFVDEVHERSLDTDFLLALLRDALPSLPHLKVVLMSATVDADTFAQYFGDDRVGRVHIEGRTFPVQDYFLDDVVRLVDKGNRAASLDPEESSDVGKTIQGLGIGINYHLIASLVQHIDEDLGNSNGGILIFLPGTGEIDRCLRALNGSNLHVLPLHASLTPSEQRLVFRRAPAGKRKVICATNVAETSITIDDIVAVIDSGKVKETHYDPTSNIVRLEEVWASQAACKQRRGRAGRVQAGKCYKLFTRNVLANMAPATTPEIRRTPLEQLYLSIKSTIADSRRSVEEFLASTISPPDSRAVATATKTLRRMGALDNDRLTGLGAYLSMIPADLRCGKLLIYGSLFECVEPCLTIAAILTTKSPFVSPREKRDEAKEARAAAFPISEGDLLLDRAAFEQWKDVSSTMRYRDVQEWCSSRFLSQQTLRDIDSTRRQLMDSLIEANLLPAGYKSGDQRKGSNNNNNNNTMLLRALIAGALNPQIAGIQMPDKKYIASMSGAKELDPDAKTIKYFNEENGRVFVHPSSVLFAAQNFSGAAEFVSYFAKMETSKTFIRDLTPLNAYALLLFGGPIEVVTSGAGILVDGWLQLRGWARIGVLASRLRALLDDDLRRRIDSPGTLGDHHGDDDDAADDDLFEIVRHLVELNGQDK
jgi:HrpA-like RNA helicase